MWDWSEVRVGRMSREVVVARMSWVQRQWYVCTARSVDLFELVLALAFALVLASGLGDAIVTGSLDYESLRLFMWLIV